MREHNPEALGYRLLDVSDKLVIDTETGLPFLRIRSEHICATNATRPVITLPYDSGPDILACAVSTRDLLASSADDSGDQEVFKLPVPLHEGEHRDLTYILSLHYTAPPPPQFFHIVGNQALRSLDVIVHFPLRHAPSDINQAEWDINNISGEPIRCEPTELTTMPRSEVRQAKATFEDVTPRRVLGFIWTPAAAR